MRISYTINKISLSILIIMLLGVITLAKEPDINSIISKYERLHLVCQKDPNKHDTECFTVYSYLASLYYDQEMANYQSKASVFVSSHPKHYDSLYYADLEGANLPKFEKSLKTYNEIISIWGEDKLTYKDLRTYSLCMYYSTYYSKAINLIDKIIKKYPDEKGIDIFEMVLNDCYVQIGRYDTAVVMINDFIKKSKDTNQIKFAQEILNNMDNIKKYSKPNK